MAEEDLLEHDNDPVAAVVAVFIDKIDLPSFVVRGLLLDDNA